MEDDVVFVEQIPNLISRRVAQSRISSISVTSLTIAVASHMFLLAGFDSWSRFSIIFSTCWRSVLDYHHLG